jgi:hypothetical protein
VLHMPQNKVATLGTTYCMLKKCAFYPHSVLIFFLLFSQCTAAVSLNSIDLLIFVVKVDCILRSGMTEKLSTMQTNVKLQCCTVELEFFLLL